MQLGRPEYAKPMSYHRADTRGKHRINAELIRLELDAKYLEEELEEVERMNNASTVCKEMLSSVEKRPDPLLPSTIGPVNPLWDRWFEGPQYYSKGCCRCWIL